MFSIDVLKRVRSCLPASRRKPAIFLDLSLRRRARRRARRAAARSRRMKRLRRKRPLPAEPPPLSSPPSAPLPPAAPDFLERLSRNGTRARYGASGSALDGILRSVHDCCDAGRPVHWLDRMEMGTLDRYLDGSMAADLVDKPGFEAVEVADAVSRALLRDWGLSIARGGARPEVKAYVPVLGRVKPRRFPGARRPRDPLPAPARAAAPLRSWAPWADEGATGGEPDDVEDVPLSALRARISASRAAQAPAAAAAKGAGGPAADEKTLKHNSQPTRQHSGSRNP